jgi:VanZ family protein
MSGKLTYLYLKNGRKLTSTCSLCTANKVEQNIFQAFFPGREILLKST